MKPTRLNHALGISIHRIYHAADTWANFDLLMPVLDRRYAKWKKTTLTLYWSSPSKQRFWTPNKLGIESKA
jgi:hypothetical protein